MVRKAQKATCFMCCLALGGVSSFNLSQPKFPSARLSFREEARIRGVRPQPRVPPLKAEGETSATPVVDIESTSRELLSVQQDAMSEITAAETLKELEELRRKYMTKKGPVQKVMNQMRYLSKEDKPKLGKVSNEVKSALETALAERKDTLENSEIDRIHAEEEIDVTLPGKMGAPRGLGHRHPITIMEELALQVLTDMGYDMVDGPEDAPEIETDYYCFTALNCPPDHPARDMQDTFYVNTEQDLEHPMLLRTHTSAVQIRQLEKKGPPLAIVAPGRVYRRDTPDATHAPEFHQMEILRIEKKGELDLGHLKGTVEYFLKKMFGPEVKTRFRGSYFPFTEPSMEVDIWFKGKWMEVLGCGMVDPAVLEMAGVDPEEYCGIAAGFGIERFTMVLFGIPDLRLFWDSDMRFMEQWPSGVEDLKLALKQGSLGSAA